MFSVLFYMGVRLGHLIPKKKIVSKAVIFVALDAFSELHGATKSPTLAFLKGPTPRVCTCYCVNVVCAGWNMRVVWMMDVNYWYVVHCYAFKTSATGIDPKSWEALADDRSRWRQTVSLDWVSRDCLWMKRGNEGSRDQHRISSAHQYLRLGCQFIV